MPRVVVDVNVLVSALLRHDTGPADVLRAWRDGLFELVVSPKLLAELVHVTARPALARRINPIALDRLIAALQAEIGDFEDPEPPDRVVGADPKDDYVISLSRAAGAHAIVTGDRHLLDVDSLRPPALTPRAFLAWLERLV